MAIIRNPNTPVNVTAKVPPGAYCMRFYQQGAVTATTSGVDCHPTGARLIRVIAMLATVSSADVVLGFQKNGVEVFQLTIPANEKTAYYDVKPIEGGYSMDFAAVTDLLQVAVVTAGSGGQELTVLAVFDR